MLFADVLADMLFGTVFVVAVLAIAGRRILGSIDPGGKIKGAASESAVRKITKWFS